MEVEFESKNFLRHGQDPKKCDVIVAAIQRPQKLRENRDGIRCRLYALHLLVAQVINQGILRLWAMRLYVQDPAGLACYLRSLRQE